MIAKIYSAIPDAFTGNLIEVEGDINQGLPALNIVGMANKTICESRERVRSALVNSGFTFPTRKLTINLAPAELSKDGSHLDLPIALTILVLSNQLLQANVNHRLFVGELSLDGKTKPIRGIINIIETAKQAGYKEIYLPKANLPQAALIENISLFGVDNLMELYLHLKQIKPLKPYHPSKTHNSSTQKSPTPIIQSIVKNNYTDTNSITLDDIKGQTLAKRALEIAIAGHHNILLSGPPGTGKTLLARAAASLLPPLSTAEQIAVTKLHALTIPLENIIQNRPFRSPHHTASPASIIGGGSQATPGEISLAHGGILFLDEFPEFPRNVLEALRQPLEDGVISISRANKHTAYPANFMLIATMNPCPCGYLGDKLHPCTCTQNQIQHYRSKISGPILDRIDLIVQVPRLKNSDLISTPSPNIVKNTQTDQTNPPSHHSVVKNNIINAISHQTKRYSKPGFFNSSLSPKEISKYIKLTPSATALLQTALSTLNLSARSYYKIIKISRTIADLANSNLVETEHISEALAFREISH